MRRMVPSPILQTGEDRAQAAGTFRVLLCEAEGDRRARDGGKAGATARLMRQDDPLDSRSGLKNPP